MSNSVFLLLPLYYTYRPDVYLASGISFTVATIRMYTKGGESENSFVLLLKKEKEYRYSIVALFLTNIP